MNITREADAGATRSWLVDTGGATYRVMRNYNPKDRVEWSVSVLVQGGRRQHWRAIKGKWVIEAVRAWENNRTAAA